MQLLSVWGFSDEELSVFGVLHAIAFFLGFFWMKFLSIFWIVTLNP